jgi:hypothetical protein
LGLGPTAYCADGVFHVIGLGLFNVRVDEFLAKVKDHRRYDFGFVMVMGITTMWAIERRRGQRPKQ